MAVDQTQLLMEKNEYDIQSLRVNSVGGIETPAQLTERIFQSVALQEEAFASGISLALLNRRYGKKASQLGTTASEVVLGLVEAKRVVLVRDRKDVAFVATQDLWDALQRVLQHGDASKETIFEAFFNKAAR